MENAPDSIRRGRRERNAVIHDAIPEEILTSREARELLKIGRTKLWQLTRENMIPAYRVGAGKKAGLRYKKSELLAWLDQNRI
jgi:excisionase family DNA binding protein